MLHRTRIKSIAHTTITGTSRQRKRETEIEAQLHSDSQLEAWHEGNLHRQRCHGQDTINISKHTVFTGISIALTHLDLNR